MSNLNAISNRFYCLSPAVEFGGDRECTHHDFYQVENESPVNIGKLGYGTRVNHRSTKLPYIILNIEKHQNMKTKIIKKINDTLKLMYNTSSPYLFRLLNHYEDEHNLFLIMEAYDGETLEHKLTSNGCMSFSTALKYLKQVAIAIKTLHSNKMFNISITPDTVLIGDDCLKLTDYGLKMNSNNVDKSKVRPTFQLKSNKVTCTITPYTSPEELEAILNKMKPVVSEKTDMWNMGVLLYEMVTGMNSPFQGNSIETLCEGIKDVNVDYERVHDENCRVLLQSLLKRDPQERITLDAFFELECVKEVDVEEPVIDLNDNIINPKENNHEHNETNSAMQSLKFENEHLKKKIEKLEMQMNEEEEDNEQIINEMRKEQCNEDIDKNNDISILEITDEDDINTIEKKLLQLKAKYNELRSETNCKRKQLKNLQSTLSQAQDDFTRINTQFQTQSSNEHQTQTPKQQEYTESIKSISSKLNNFSSSNTSFKNTVNKLIALSNQHYSTELDKHNTTKTSKHDYFSTLLNEVMQLLQNNRCAIKQQKQKELERLTTVNEEIREAQQKIKELEEYKINYIMSRMKLEESEKEITFLKEKNKVDALLLETKTQSSEMYRNNLNDLDIQRCTLINGLNNANQFIQTRLPEMYDELERFVNLNNS